MVEAILLLWAWAQAPPPPRVYIVPDKSASLPDVERALQAACPILELTESKGAAEWQVRIERLDESLVFKRVQWSLVTADGDLRASGADRELKNAAKDICNALLKAQR